MSTLAWFAGYLKCFCTFLGVDRNDVPAKCGHGNLLVTQPELIENTNTVPLGMEPTGSTRGVISSLPHVEEVQVHRALPCARLG